MPTVLKTEGLTKEFGVRSVVNGLDMEVEAGDIYGFLGLNGAGKTTTIRMILNLIKPTSGKVYIFGKEVRKHFLEVIKDVGALVELPAFYPYLSAYKNMEVLRLACSNVPARRIDETLEMVGLASRKHDRVRTYSQGMRQRLGIAQALLANPRLVILDEPTNGLDPQGINSIREMIKTLNRSEGVTFIISSHLLHEIEITATRVGIIKEGKLLIQDSVDNLLARTARTVSLRASPAQKIKEIVSGKSWIEKCVEKEDGSFTLHLDPANSARLNAELVNNGVEVSELSPVKLSLEEFFLAQ